jgi:predicted esterase YcpF (UPF0227 family)
MSPRIIYLHGFNSSPASRKAQAMKAYLEQRGLGAHYACPALRPSARESAAAIEKLLEDGGSGACLVGSSLGGFYATCFAERRGARAVLINPAIDPHLGLRAYLGEQQNLYSGERYALTKEHLEQWRELNTTRITPERYLLLLETGDEVLDYRQAMGRYAGARQVVIEGGDHTLQSFSQYLPRILAFAGLA